MDSSRAARITALLAVIPIMAVTILVTWAIDDMANGHGTLSVRVLLPSLVLLLSGMNVAAVYTAPSTQSAWRWNAPLLLVAAACLLLLLRITADLLGHAT